MKRTFETVLTLRGWNDYETPDGYLGICGEFVNKLLGETPNRVRLKVRATRKDEYQVGERRKDAYVKVPGSRTQYTYNFVRDTLDSIGVKQGQKFWFRITAAK